MEGITRNFIVRIYRLEKNSPRSLVGIVEEPEKGGKHAFTTLDELWGILNHRKGLKARKQKSQRVGRSCTDGRVTEVKKPLA